MVEDSGRLVLRFSEGRGAALAWTSDIRFSDGEIEFDVKGRAVDQKSFVGAAFHIQNDTTWDVVWLRPFNFVGVDSAHHVHALQVASYPDFSWQRLRADYPGVYEAAISPVPDPNGWVHVRIAVDGTSVRVYINHAQAASVSVQLRSGLKDGGVGLWVGDMSNGDFANFTVKPKR